MYGLTSKEEIQEYLVKLYNRLLEHRYRYYVLHDPALEDSVYDWMEKYYNNLAQEHGMMLMDMVDFDFNHPLALQAGKRVDNRQDSYSLWEDDMKPVWKKLGYPRYEKERK
jgi:NAD-dependent DNA ligase